MELHDVLPAHCHARAQQLLADAIVIRDEMGRTADARPVPTIKGAQPREVYFEALVAWRKVQRLAGEVGVQTSSVSPSAPALPEIKPGHVLQLLEAVADRIGDIRERLRILEHAQEPAVQDGKEPSDVLATLIQVNRELSRALERPFTPSDVYRTVALAQSYASRLGPAVPQAPYVRRRQPADCYARLEACLVKAGEIVARRKGTALAARGVPTDIVPGDVYDLASLVLGEVAFLHALTAEAAPVHAFDPEPAGHHLPSHVDQLARTLEAQLAAIA